IPGLVPDRDLGPPGRTRSSCLVSVTPGRRGQHPRGWLAAGDAADEREVGAFGAAGCSPGLSGTIVAVMATDRSGRPTVAHTCQRRRVGEEPGCAVPRRGSRTCPTVRSGWSQRVLNYIRKVDPEGPGASGSRVFSPMRPDVRGS